MWDLIVSIPDYCLSFYFESRLANQSDSDSPIAKETHDKNFSNLSLK